MQIDTAALESLAEELMPIPDMALFLGVHEQELRDAIEEPGTPAYYAFNRGRIKTERTLRRRTLLAAIAPEATQAQVLAAQEIARRFSES